MVTGKVGNVAVPRPQYLCCNEVEYLLIVVPSSQSVSYLVLFYSVLLSEPAFPLPSSLCDK